MVVGLWDIKKAMCNGQKKSNCEANKTMQYVGHSPGKTKEKAACEQGKPTQEGKTTIGERGD